MGFHAGVDYQNSGLAITPDTFGGNMSEEIITFGFFLLVILNLKVKTALIAVTPANFGAYKKVCYSHR